MKMKHSMFLFSQIMDGTAGTEAEMTVGFIKNALSLLTFFSAVRHNDFKGHLQAERKMFKYCFVFNYLNCTLVFKQQVHLRKLQRSILMLQWILHNALLVNHFQEICFPACIVI